MMRIPLLLAAAALAAAAPPSPDATMKLNDIQVLGSHNSFKRQISPAVMKMLRKMNPKTADSLDYQHGPLTQQLDTGLRQLEIDVFADPTGGRYADPAGERLARAAGEATGFDRAAMLKPGFKAFHVPDIDYLSNCPTLVGCLREIDTWSRAHPGHLPLMITINAHDVPIGRPGITDPLRLDGPALDALDAEIRSVIAPNRLIVPDDVRGKAATLRDAVLADGWPALKAARGKIVLLFDVPDDIAHRYRTGHPSLAGRAMFAFYNDAQPESAMIVVQDPIVDGAKIRRWVEKGYIIRTRSDADTVEARSRDLRKAHAAAASGAQAISTDYYPGAPDPQGRRFSVTLPGSATERCNPVRRVSGCDLVK
ncbi:Ca2+-dependent phosphoinositide-specific phospholipase C [uncultured Sphingomonas sp.]|uniref:Ca2+-dependent phosphoinositide-specific phospholipase C n=1 Tax=uncultured Sphingomonas sp. TaxID=158754 RepID=UPI0035CB0378